jgi:hypothetical protein
MLEIVQGVVREKENTTVSKRNRSVFGRKQRS